MILRNQEIISSIIHRHPNAPILIATGSLKMKIMNQEYFDFIQKYNNLYVFGNSKEKFIENTGYPSHPIRLALARKDKNDKYVFDLLRKEEIDGYVIN
ncbi:hypothetical protein [Holzapfeliella floricola]|nr:hypothetical protein [Holzapfeliella floricola]